MSKVSHTFYSRSIIHIAETSESANRIRKMEFQNVSKERNFLSMKPKWKNVKRERRMWNNKNITTQIVSAFSIFIQSKFNWNKFWNSNAIFLMGLSHKSYCAYMCEKVEPIKRSLTSCWVARFSDFVAAAAACESICSPERKKTNRGLIDCLKTARLLYMFTNKSHN